jgi:hypothetical protein
MLYMVSVAWAIFVVFFCQDGIQIGFGFDVCHFASRATYAA